MHPAKAPEVWLCRIPTDAVRRFKNRCRPIEQWRFQRSAGSITGTSGSRPEHRSVPFESSRLAMKTPPGSPRLAGTSCSAESLADGSHTHPNAVSLKTTCLLRGEKRIAAGGEGSVGSPDEIKRRDRQGAETAERRTPDQATDSKLVHNKWMSWDGSSSSFSAQRQTDCASGPPCSTQK